MHPAKPSEPVLAPYKYVFGMCPACGGMLKPPDWTDGELLRRGYRHCSKCGQLVVPAREGYVVKETPRCESFAADCAALQAENARLRAELATVRALVAEIVAEMQAALAAAKEEDNAPDNPV